MGHGYIAQSDDPLLSLAEEHNSSSAPAWHTATIIKLYAVEFIILWLDY